MKWHSAGAKVNVLEIMYGCDSRGWSVSCDWCKAVWDVVIFRQIMPGSLIQYFSPSTWVSRSDPLLWNFVLSCRLTAQLATGVSCLKHSRYLRGLSLSYHLANDSVIMPALAILFWICPGIKTINAGENVFWSIASNPCRTVRKQSTWW